MGITSLAKLTDVFTAACVLVVAGLDGLAALPQADRIIVNSAKTIRVDFNLENIFSPKIRTG
jgi:hypothetical protein